MGLLRTITIMITLIAMSFFGLYIIYAVISAFINSVKRDLQISRLTKMLKNELKDKLIDNK